MDQQNPPNRQPTRLSALPAPRPSRARPLRLSPSHPAALRQQRALCSRGTHARGWNRVPHHQLHFLVVDALRRETWGHGISTCGVLSHYVTFRSSFRERSRARRQLARRAKLVSHGARWRCETIEAWLAGISQDASMRSPALPNLRKREFRPERPNRPPKRRAIPASRKFAPRQRPAG
jgi:hypothetical protein